METIYKTPSLFPYFQIAEEHAESSPCVRRKYAALIGYKDGDHLWTVESNNRQSKCCNNECSRTMYGFQNGERVEVGAEIHAETAALISAPTKGEIFIL